MLSGDIFEGIERTACYLKLIFSLGLAAVNDLLNCRDRIIIAYENRDSRCAVVTKPYSRALKSIDPCQGSLKFLSRSFYLIGYRTHN